MNLHNFQLVCGLPIRYKLLLTCFSLISDPKVSLFYLLTPSIPLSICREGCRGEYKGFFRTFGAIKDELPISITL